MIESQLLYEVWGEKDITFDNIWPRTQGTLLTLIFRQTTVPSRKEREDELTVQDKYNAESE